MGDRMENGLCSTHGEMRNAYRILAGKPGGKRIFSKTKSSILNKIGCEGVD
jgi:hypothetical protein